MDRSYVPIVEFYKKCLPAARKNGYKYVMCLLARDRNDGGLYATLEKDWYALDDITGKDFLFMFTGKFDEDDTDSAINCGNNFLLCNEYIHAINPKPKLHLNSGYDFDGREKRARFTSDLPINHTREIAALRKHFHLSEADVPCLVFTNLSDFSNIVVPFSEKNIYDYFRTLYISLESTLSDLRLWSDDSLLSKAEKIASLRKELLIEADSLRDEEKRSLLVCIEKLAYGKFAPETRKKLNRYVDLAKPLVEVIRNITDSEHSDVEPWEIHKKVDALYQQADSIIRDSVLLAKTLNKEANQAGITMVQTGNNSVQIGQISGGNININVVEGITINEVTKPVDDWWKKEIYKRVMM